MWPAADPLAILTAVSTAEGEAEGEDQSRAHPEVTERIRGLAVHRRAQPGATRVVLVHGAMDRGASFIKATRRLPDLEIVRYDRRGYGRSVDVVASPDLDVQVRDLEAIVGATPSVVVGHSLGGVIALALAGRRPELVLAVAAFEAPMPWAPWWPGGSAGSDAIRRSETTGPEDAAERFMRRMIGDERWERLPPSTRAARRAEGPALIADLRSVRIGGTSHPPYRLDDLRLPVVAGRGSLSDGHHRQAAEALADGVVDGELFVVDGAGHGAHHTHPGPFAAFVQRTVDRAGQRSGPLPLASEP